MNIVVVGLGVIGGSYVQALKGKGHHVYGIDLDQDTLDQAKAGGFIEEGYIDGSEIIKESDFTIICLYPSEIIKFIKLHTFKPGSIVTDVVGIKSYYLDEVFSIIDPSVEYIAGHPMAGREKRGFAYADASVFQNANFIIINHPNNHAGQIKMMEDFVSDIGFKSVRIVSPQDHDRIISFTSQLPHVIAVSLINSDNNQFDTGKYIGDSFRDLTRIANINEDLWSELFINNKEFLLESITRFEEKFNKMKTAILEGDDQSLKAEFIESTKRRENLEK